jgi:hypothetical protein
MNDLRELESVDIFTDICGYGFEQILVFDIFNCVALNSSYDLTPIRVNAKFKSLLVVIIDNSEDIVMGRFEAFYESVL